MLAGYGDAWAAIELGRGMGPDHTLLALQPPDDPAEFAALRGPADLAALYVDELRRRQPEGPYFLGGYSAGAYLALEMARLLRRDGAEVGSVLMFDPLFVRFNALERISYRGLELGVAVLAPFFRHTRGWKILSAMVQDRGLKRHLEILDGYHPQPYEGTVTLYETRWSRIVRPPTFIRDLRRVALGGLERRRPAGTHHSFMRPPHVAELGREIVARMACV